ncbi:MAG: cob(I)yrinic acid a,c-diamide adenosyltransferase [Acidobacteria bacterium]|nr:MAG: cob(I)yrinic acid a,c-diamide adenosyltransferase [Acidobacteriota bacterium]
MKIYTKTGDRGDTRLFDGTKVRKYDDRVEAYGAIDELNSFIGASSTFLQDPALKVMLAEIQKDLFSVGAQLADPGFRDQSRAKFQLDPGRIAALENAIDSFETELPPLRQFILAGGGHGGALLHVARTVCRRAERRVVSLSEKVEIHPNVIVYLNRLSDFLFVIARLVNHREGKQEILW